MTRALVLAQGARGERCTATVLGLQVTERVVVNLQHRGVESVVVAGSRLTLPEARREGVRFLEGEAGTNDEVEQIRRISQEEPEDLLVIAGDLVYHPDLPAELRRRAEEEGRSQVIWEGAAHPLLYLRQADAQALPNAADLEALVERLVADGACRRLETPDRFVVPATSDEERQRAARLLLRLNWRPHDGLVARYVNKHISTRVSTWLSGTPITPNQMTVLAFAIAMVGVGLATVGSYLTFVAGALLVQIQSILDGCDGELSRMRYQASRTGAWLDTIVDDIIGTLWVCALGYGLYRASGQMVYLGVGLGAGLCHLITTVQIYTALIQHGGVGHQDFVWWWEERPAGGAAVKEESGSSPFGWIKYLARRDFYVLIYLFLALLNLMPVALLLEVLGSVAMLVVSVIQVAKRGFAMKGAPQNDTENEDEGGSSGGPEVEAAEPDEQPPAVSDEEPWGPAQPGQPAAPDPER